MTSPKDIEFSSLENAISSLKKALNHAPKNDLERDGVIQRFKYTFELCWKFIRRFLIIMGRRDVSGSPRPLLRDSREEHLISDVKTWFDFLEARNDITRTYNESEANKVYHVAKRFPPFAEELLAEIKKRVRE